MKWEHLTDGAEVLRFWKTVPTQGQEPETAILHLSGQRYAELTKDGKGFINRYRVFDKDVQSMTMTAASVTSSMTAQAAPQIVVVIHRPTCAAVAAAVADLSVAMAA